MQTQPVPIPSCQQGKRPHTCLAISFSRWDAWRSYSPCLRCLLQGHGLKPVSLDGCKGHPKSLAAWPSRPAMSSQRAEAQETELLQKAAEQTNANHEVKTPRGFDVKKHATKCLALACACATV